MILLIEQFKSFFKKYKEILKTIGESLAIACGEIIKIVNPATAAPIEMLKKVFPELKEFQLNQILEGLVKSENEEMRVNQLYQYSQKSDGRNILYKLSEQAVSSSSTKTLVILGIMLSDCMKENSDPSYEDVIVMNALRAASDYEIKYIKEICEQYVDEDNYIDCKRIDNSQLAKEYNRTLKWGVTNRVIEETGERHFKDLELVGWGDFLIVNECTEKLIYYINKAKQVLEYGKHRNSK